MKNPNATKFQLRSLSSRFSVDDWTWLNTQIKFLDAMDSQTPDEIAKLADVLLTERVNAEI